VNPEYQWGRSKNGPPKRNNRLERRFIELNSGSEWIRNCAPRESILNTCRVIVPVRKVPKGYY
jgi:hypothetical protein